MKVVAMPPVYPPELVAKIIVKVSRKPENEVIAGGPIAKALVAQHRKTPNVVEAQMAQQTDKTHLSLTTAAPRTHGALYSPPAAREASVTGGWHGRDRAGSRKILGSIVAAAIGVLLARSYLANERS